MHPVENLHYMHNEVRKDNKKGAKTYCLVYFDFGTYQHVYHFIKVH